MRIILFCFIFDYSLSVPTIRHSIKKSFFISLWELMIRTYIINSELQIILKNSNYNWSYSIWWGQSKGFLLKKNWIISELENKSYGEKQSKKYLNRSFFDFFYFSFEKIFYLQKCMSELTKSKNNLFNIYSTTNLNNQ